MPGAPVPDATDPCTECGAVEWELGGSDVTCGACGHAVGLWTSYGFVEIDEDARPGDPSEWDVVEPVAPLTTAQDAQLLRDTFAAARFPVYGLDGWEGERSWASSSWSGAGEGEAPETTSVGLEHGAGLVVTTAFTRRARAGEPLQEAFGRLVSTGMGGFIETLSPGAFAVRAEYEHTRSRALAESVVTREVAVRIDGRPHTFTVGACGSGWAAFCDLDAGDGGPGDRALTVLVEARDQPFAPFALATVTDIAPYLPHGA